MPLLKRKAFEKSTASEYLRDDDEVFHCEVTDEIFKDYEEYCHRIILVNSMVWTCEMTGKNSLTYAEALESEKAARKSLKDFPMELRIPILFLAAKTNRSSFADMSEDVFNFVRERYFVGETVEACLESDNWEVAHVLTVTAQKQQPGSTAIIPATSYVYEVEQFDEDSEDAGQIATVPHDRVRRRKGVYSREKNKLFLKQYVEQQDGIIRIKKQALDKYNISKVHFDQIFTDNPPEFPSTKKVIKSPAASKSTTKPGSASKVNKKKTPEKGKGKQESMDKFIKKTEKKSIDAAKPKVPSDPAAKKSAQDLAQKMRQAEDEMRKRREEEKARKKEKHARLQAYLKEWQKAKDDLELEDHKAIPIGTPVEMEGIPQKHIGDFLSVMEFVYIYAETLKAKDVFGSKGLDIDTFRKALTQKDHAGTFSDLVQMMLTTIFSLQEDEAEDHNEDRGIQESMDDTENDAEMGVTMTRAVELATKASKWSQTYLGTPLNKLPLDPTTITEVLRLHFLTSGSAPGSRCATWRYQQRGGYSSHDDPGLRLRIQHPALLQRLAVSHVAHLSLDDKFLVLQCLMNQILSYATVRDIVEEKLEDFRNKRYALRMLQINERKREMQVVTSRQELKKEYTAKMLELKLTGEAAKTNEEELTKAIEKINKENEDKKKEFEKKAKELSIEMFDYTSFLGSDRAFRRYWVNQIVAGVFVEAGEDNLGVCREKLVLPAQREEDTLAYVTRLFETQKDRASSDKENDSAANSRGNSPKKPLTNLNGLNQKLNGIDHTQQTQQLQELWMCTGDVNSCLVHGSSDRPRWWFYHTEEQIDTLIKSLNKRGIRENELKSVLEQDKQNIFEYIKKCPVHYLNPTAAPPPPAPVARGRPRAFQQSIHVPDDITLSEALELSLRDHILELEEKIFHGCLGAIKVKDREAWRGTLMLKGYDKQVDHLTFGPNKRYRDDNCTLLYGTPKVTEDAKKEDTKPAPEYKYRDPGYYLEASKVNGIKLEPKEEAKGLETKAETVRALASALLQVSQAIHHKYLRRPLGLDDKERKEREAKNKPMDLEALERWEISLMECKSFSQIALHLFTLDSSIMWSASILNASCKICRRKTDSENMLLCDSCNKGHHMYCLKPKLTKVPEGDWYCEQCRPKERTPRKRRNLFTEVTQQQEEKSDSDSEEDSDIDMGVCASCGSGGKLATTCHACGTQYHTECAFPKPGRAAKRWSCAECLGLVPPKKHHSTRRCAANALNNIHQYAKALDTTQFDSDSEDSEENTALVNLKPKKNRSNRSSKEPSPMLNGDVRKRSRRSKDIDTNATKGKKVIISLTNGVHEPRKSKNRTSSSRKRRSRSTEALNQEALQQLLKEIMKHRDAWPFMDPVNADEVPDYMDIIEQPMDFTTIKQKADDGEYTMNEEVIEDIALVFLNCYTYNQESHPVAKAGVRLEKYISKRCSELELPPLPDIQATPDTESEHSSTANKRRATSEDSDQPRAKKSKHK